jgi:hypothetical protein
MRGAVLRLTRDGDVYREEWLIASEG